MKLKHNKKRNTVFLYEVLVRHLTKSILDHDLKKKKRISRVIKEHFRRGTVLREELEIYRVVSTKERLNYHLAEKMIFEAKKAHSRLDQGELFKEQSTLIKKINQLLSKDAYSIFVPNYKSMASVHQIFNDQTPLKTRVILEEKIIRNLCIGNISSENTMTPVGNIVYKTFARKFNKTYKDNLLEEQKTLLNKYIISFADNGMDLKVFLSEEVDRLKTLIEVALEKEEIIREDRILSKIKEVAKIIDGFRGRDVDQAMVEQVLKIQSLVKEI